MELLMARVEAPKKVMLRDQRRALHAYEAVGRVAADKQTRDNYKTAVNNLGANILRSGLCAAIASVQRSSNGGGALLSHLASAGVTGLEGATAGELPKRVRELDADGYMIATREMMQVAVWLKRAAQATFEGT
jgi:CRISPR-associated protein Cmr5